MPNAVAQKRKTTLAAPTIAGRSAGSVTVRSTCHGDAPSAAAAWPGRGSSDSHATPTVRTTTATLKKTSPQMIATGVPSRPRKPSGPPSPSSWRKATPTTTVGSTNGTSSAARTAARPGSASRCRAYAAGSPRTTDSSVATPERPHREPRDPVHARPRQHLEHRAGREAAVGHEALARPCRSPAARRARRAPAPARRPAAGAGERCASQRRLIGTTTSVHSVSHCSRLAAISSGATS